MAGTLRGKIDCYSNDASAALRGNEIFKGWFDHMENLVVLGVCTRIALQYGDTGTGVDYHDGVNPFSTHAWALYRFAANGGRKNDFYVRGTLGQGSTTGNNADPWLVESNTVNGGIFAVSYASALDSDGTTNADPWGNATRNNDGTDLVGVVPGTGPVWVEGAGGPGATLAVWPISNADGNSDGTNKENTVSLIKSNAGGSSVRFGFISDDDNLFMYADDGDNLTTRWIWFGHFTFRAGVTGKYDLSMLCDDSSLDIDSAIYGTTSGISANESGVFSPPEQNMTRLGLSSIERALRSTSQPSNIPGVTQFEEFPLYAVGVDPGLTAGTLGTFDTFIKIVLGITDQDTKTDLSRIVFGAASTLTLNITVPWDGVTPPRANFTRAGIEF